MQMVGEVSLFIKTKQRVDVLQSHKAPICECQLKIKNSRHNYNLTSFVYFKSAL